MCKIGLAASNIPLLFYHYLRKITTCGDAGGHMYVLVACIILFNCRALGFYMSWARVDSLLNVTGTLRVLNCFVRRGLFAELTSRWLG
jgi:hypothetical protein